MAAKKAKWRVPKQTHYTAMVFPPSKTFATLEEAKAEARDMERYEDAAVLRDDSGRYCAVWVRQIWGPKLFRSDLPAGMTQYTIVGYWNPRFAKWLRRLGKGVKRGVGLTTRGLAKAGKVTVRGISESVKPRFQVFAVNKQTGETVSFGVRGTTRAEILARVRGRMKISTRLNRVAPGEYETPDWDLSISRALPYGASIRRATTRYQTEIAPKLAARSDVMMREAYRPTGIAPPVAAQALAYTITATNRKTGEAKSFTVQGMSRDEVLGNIGLTLGVLPSTIARIGPNHLSSADWDIWAR